MYIHIYIHIYTYICKCICITHAVYLYAHALSHALSFSQPLSLPRKHTHTHTHILTSTWAHTPTHVYLQIYVLSEALRQETSMRENAEVQAAEAARHMEALHHEVIALQHHPPNRELNEKLQLELSQADWLLGQLQSANKALDTDFLLARQDIASLEQCLHQVVLLVLLLLALVRHSLCGVCLA